MIRLVPASSQSAQFVLPGHYGLIILTQARFIAEFRQAISAAGPPDVRPFEVILSVAVRPLGPLITVYRVNSYRYTETGRVMRIMLI